MNDEGDRLERLRNELAQAIDLATARLAANHADALARLRGSEELQEQLRQRRHELREQLDHEA